MLLQTFRFVASPLAGVAIFLLLMDILTGYVPVDFVSIAVLTTSYVVATVGGFATGAVAPRLKIFLAAATGALFPAAYYWSVLFADWPENSDPLSLDVMWSLGLIPSFLAGGALARRMTRASD